MDLYLATFKSFVVQWSAKIAGHQAQLKPLQIKQIYPFYTDIFITNLCLFILTLIKSYFDVKKETLLIVNDSKAEKMCSFQDFTCQMIVNNYFEVTWHGTVSSRPLFVEVELRPKTYWLVHWALLVASRVITILLAVHAISMKSMYLTLFFI